VERLNSRHRSLQHKRNKTKWSQNEESVQEREGEKEERESHEIHHKTNPGGHEVVRATILAANLKFLHESLNLWTSPKNPKGRRN
jgi:hypothetical protein